MRTYDNYKESGIQWIGEIPEHWEVKKIKHTTYIKARVGWKGLRSDEFLDEGFAYLLTGTDIKNGSVDWQNSYFIDKARYDDDPFIQLQEDDLLITKDGTIGKIAIVDKLEKPTCLNSGVFVLRSTGKSWLTKYQFNILASNIFKSFIDYTSYGSTILHLYQNVFNEFQFPLPPFEEQTAIANYLDSKTTEIDQIVADKEALVSLYGEEKKALINEAVSKGLNAIAKLKPSNIDWLGDVPEHWEVKKLKNVTTSIQTGKTPPTNNEEYFLNDDYNWFTPGDFGNSIMLSNSTRKISQLAVEGEGLKLFEKHTVLLVAIGATLGKIGIVTDVCFANQQINSITFNQSEIFQLFGAFFLESKTDMIKKQSVASTLAILNQEKTKELLITVPPLEEQTAIVQYIESETANINDKINQIKQEIALLKEYRQALIFEAVTGKIRVD